MLQSREIYELAKIQQFPFYRRSKIDDMLDAAYNQVLQQIDEYQPTVVVQLVDYFIAVDLGKN